MPASGLEDMASAWGVRVSWSHTNIQTADCSGGERAVK